MSFITTLKSLNKNVQLVFGYSFLQSLGRGIWLGNILSAYLYFFAGSSNITLGWTSEATGIAFTAVLFPSGYLADRFRRDILLKISSIFGLIGLIILIMANNLTMIFVSLIFWGMAQGTGRPSLESLFADSLPSGSRSGIYSKIHLIRNGAQSIGPFLNILLFIYFGNDWDLSILRTVMIIGLMISMLSLITLQFFDDDNALTDISEAIELEKVSEEDEPSLSKRRQYIPMILVLSNLIVGAGAGMTIKFFPIFFLEVYSLQPIAVNAILGATSITTGVTAIFAQKLSLKRGRVMMILVVQGIATMCLFALAFYPVIFLLVPIFIARGSLMNAAQPLSRSILMDYVPKKNRGKWNSVESLAWGLFWNSSAVLGGYLIDYISFSFAFTITGVIYLVSLVPLFTLMPLVRSEKPIAEVLQENNQETGDEEIRYTEKEEELIISE